ncbi:hypothetical protein NP118_23740, partial [Salmonella enterica]|nr:hypothetical protein [Salmonella enterica]
MKICEEHDKIRGQLGENQSLFCPENCSRRVSVGTLSVQRLDAIAISRCGRVEIASASGRCSLSVSTLSRFRAIFRSLRGDVGRNPNCWFGSREWVELGPV